MPQQDQKSDDGPLLLGNGQHNGEVRELQEEHARLRDEIDRLRQEQRKLKEGTDQKTEESKEEKEEPKEPAQRRAAHWASAHRLAILATLAGLVVLVIAGIFLWWRYLQSYESTDDAEIGGHIDQIGSRIPGTVVGVYVENSQAVKKGQVLVDLDPRDYQVSVEQSKANLRQAQANIESQSPNVPITTTTQATQVATAD